VNLVDTSKWIDVLRGTNSAVATTIHRLVAKDPSSIATTEPIIVRSAGERLTARDGGPSLSVGG
jgi:hypothetical protein